MLCFDGRKWVNPMFMLVRFRLKNVAYLVPASRFFHKTCGSGIPYMGILQKFKINVNWKK